MHRGPIFNDYFHQPNAAQIGVMVAILEVGAFVSSLIVGRLGDIIGRRKTILYGSLIFVSYLSCGQVHSDNGWQVREWWHGQVTR